jgi:hypothetical protein
MPEPIADAGSNPFPFLGHFMEVPRSAEGSPLIPAINLYIAPSDNPPWVPPQVFDNRINNHPNSERPHHEGMSAETLQATVPQTSKLKFIRPSKKSSNTSSTLEWQLITPGTISPQPLGADRPGMRSQPKPGCRNGPLAPANAVHAKEMREAGACWACRFAKVKVC